MKRGPKADRSDLPDNIPPAGQPAPRELDRQRTVHKLVRFAAWMDDRFRIPGTNWRLGLDALIGLVPVVGDVATAALSAYLIAEAQRLGVPKHLISRMIANIIVDAAVGSVPLIGDLFDIGWRANSKNVRLLQDHLAEAAKGDKP